MPAEPDALVPPEEQNLQRKEQLLRWLKRHWSESHKCPVCASSDWQIDDYGKLPTESVATAAYPLYPITCQACGYVFFLNGIVAGALPAEDRPAP